MNWRIRAFGREYRQRLYAKTDDKSLFTVVADRYIESQELQPKTIASYRTAVKIQEQGTVGKYRSSANLKK